MQGGASTRRSSHPGFERGSRRHGLVTPSGGKVIVPQTSFAAQHATTSRRGLSTSRTKRSCRSLQSPRTTSRSTSRSSRLRRLREQQPPTQERPPTAVTPPTATVPATVAKPSDDAQVSTKAPPATACGPDVTDYVLGVLKMIQNTYTNSWNAAEREKRCGSLYGLGFQAAWDLQGFTPSGYRRTSWIRWCGGTRTTGTKWWAPTVRSSATRTWRPLGSTIFPGASSGDQAANHPKRSVGAKSRSAELQRVGGPRTQ